jgi:hypothetical protein
MVRIYLVVMLIASVIFGGLYLVAPSLVFGQTGIEPATAAGLTDLRATYAGFQLGMAGLLYWCLRDETRHAAALVAVACVVGGLALSRVLGLMLDGFSAEMAVAATLETALTGFAIHLLRRQPHRNQ